MTQTITIPMGKCLKALKMLQEVLSSRTITVLKLQKLMGLLNVLSTAYIPGRTFTRQLYTKYNCTDLKQH